LAVAVISRRRGGVSFGVGGGETNGDL
jgi:hypothetical protein